MRMILGRSVEVDGVHPLIERNRNAPRKIGRTKGRKSVFNMTEEYTYTHSKTMSFSNEIDITIEVNAADVLEGVSEIHGSLGHDDEVLVLSFYKKKLLGGVTEDETLSLPLKDIQDVKLKKGPVTTKLLLYPKRLNIIEGVPGNHSDRLKFQIKKADKQYAEPFVASLRSAIFNATEEGLDSVPFKLEDTNMGFTEHSGMLYMDEEFLVFDIQSGLNGVTRPTRQQVKVAPKALSGIRLKQGTTKDTLFIKPKKQKLLDAIPGDHKREVKLKIKKKHRVAVERLIQRVVNWSI